MDKISLDLLKKIAGLDKIPSGAVSFRENGQSVVLKSTDEIIISKKTDKPGIDILVKSSVKGKSLHIPVVVSKAGLKDLVYNDFYIEEGADVTIVAGCGIHNCTSISSGHDGIHTFHIAKNAYVRYIENHMGVGEINSERIFNPTTIVNLSENSHMIMETSQLGGVSNTNRKTIAFVKDNSSLIIKEKIQTDNNEVAKTNFNVYLVGKNSKCEVVSRSVAKGKSKQTFKSNLVGKNECFGRVECDGIIVNKAKIYSVPQIKAENINSNLTHEATIGKIAGDELIKLQTLGLTKEKAEQEIIAGFLS